MPHTRTIIYLLELHQKSHGDFFSKKLLKKSVLARNNYSENTSVPVQQAKPIKNNYAEIYLVKLINTLLEDFTKLIADLETYSEGKHNTGYQTMKMLIYKNCLD